MNVKIIDGRKRMRFLPTHFGIGDMMPIESRVYTYAREVLDTYTGGMWEFAETPNGQGFLIPPAGPVTVHLRDDANGDTDVPGGYRWRPSEISCCDGGPITRHAAGLALTILAVNHHLPGARDQGQLEREWEGLMNFAHDPQRGPEMAMLFSILD